MISGPEDGADPPQGVDHDVAGPDGFRARFRAARREIPVHRARQLSAAASARICEVVQSSGGDVVGLYSATDGEVDPIEAARTLFERGHTVYLPVTTDSGQRLRFARFTETSDLRRSPLGTLEPHGTDIIEVDQLDVLIVPGIVFDTAGNRMGFGQGWYDRTIGDLDEEGTGPVIVGCCYDEQIVASLRPQPWDKPVQMIVTPSATITCTDNVSPSFPS